MTKSLEVLEQTMKFSDGNPKRIASALRGIPDRRQ